MNLLDSAWSATSTFTRATMLESCTTVIGDKVLARPKLVHRLATAYPDARWVFIFRDVEDVAASYEARAGDAEDVNWPETKGYRSALVNWREGFEAADLLEAQVGADRLLPVRYEALFDGNLAALGALLSHIGVSLTEDVHRSFVDITSGWSERRVRRTPLSDDATRWLGINKDHAKEQEYRTRVLATFERSA